MDEDLEETSLRPRSTAPRHHHQHRRRAKKASTQSTTNYDDVFGGPPRHAVPFSGVPEDYSEVFGGVSVSCSIPFLDLPTAQMVDGWDCAGGDSGNGVDYKEIFGRCDFADFAVPYEELFGRGRAEEGEIDMHFASANGRSSFKSRSGPQTTDPSVFIQEYSNGDTIPYLDDANFSVTSGEMATEYNTSYSKSSRTRSKELLHTTASVHQPQTGFTFVVEPTKPLPEHHSLVNEDTATHEISVESNSKSAANTQAISNNEAEQPGVPFLDIADVSLLTRSPNLPPPARPPPSKFLVNERHKISTIPKTDPASNLSTEAEQPPLPQQEKPKSFLKSDSLPPNFDFVPNLKLDKREKPKLKSRPNTFSKSESLPPGFGSELDAMKEAMEFAQARLKTAKELHEKRREGKITELPLRKKHVKEENLEGSEVEKPRILRSISLASNFSKSREFMKVQSGVAATQGTRELEKSGKWRSDEEFHELTSIELTKERESKVGITVTEPMVERSKDVVQINGLPLSRVELTRNINADVNATVYLERTGEMKSVEDSKREEETAVGSLEILTGSQEPVIEKEPNIIQNNFNFELEKEIGDTDIETLKEYAKGIPNVEDVIDIEEVQAGTEDSSTVKVGTEIEDGDRNRLDEELQSQNMKEELEKVTRVEKEMNDENEKERSHKLEEEKEILLQPEDKEERKYKLEDEKEWKLQMEKDTEEKERGGQERIMAEEEERLARERMQKWEEESERERLEKEKEEKQRMLAEKRERERKLEEERQEEKMREKEMLRKLEEEKERERKLAEEVEKERERVRKLEEEREQERERVRKLEEEKQREREMALKLEKEKEWEKKLQEEIEKERETVRKLEEEREREREKVRKLEEERELERERVRKLEEERELERERVRQLEEEREREKIERERERNERQKIEKEMEQRERERRAKEQEQKGMEKKLEEEREKQRIEKEKEEREKQRKMEKEREEKEMAMRLEADKRRLERKRAEEREIMTKLQGEKAKERKTEARKSDEEREREIRMKEKERKTEGRKSDEEREKARGRKSDEERERERGRRAWKEREIEERERDKEEEEEERQREREKDRLAMERATQERAERIAIERITAARQRAVDNREKEEMNTRGGGEGFEKKRPKGEEEKKERDGERNAREARLRAERAAVERATAEARERAIEKAKAEADKRDRLERLKSFNRISSQDNEHESHLKRTQSDSALSQGPGESALRHKARLERQQRTAERAAKALAEKNRRDIMAQREQAERDRIAEHLDADVRRWSSGKEGNLRALLSTLQYILGQSSGWQPIHLTEVITAADVKRAYRKATLYVHPDKLQQRGASIQQKYICEKVFDLLKEAWNKFNSEER